MPETISTGGADTSTGSSSTGGAEGSSTSTTGSSGGTTLLLDVGSREDVGPVQPPGCKGKIDFLFVISRWAGMEYFQKQLLDAFPKFIDTIEAKFADFDYHIMVVDGDADWGLAPCDDQCAMNGWCEVPGYPCWYVDEIEACDATIGAGVVFPAGDGASNAACDIDGGRRYMTREQADLKSVFACAAQVGSSGDAWMGEALAAALKPGINGAGGCNEGFLRDDALLMVTMISNTYDYGPKPMGSKGTPATWAAALLEAKHDDPDSIVLFSVLDPGEPECHENDRTCQMVKMFPHRLLIERAEPDYGPAFEQATELVAAVCASFVPPG